jgi:hypothetical protein
MRIEAGADLSRMQSRSKSRSAILQKMRDRHLVVSASLGYEIN